jgi:hypothetical protein
MSNTQGFTDENTVLATFVIASPENPELSSRTGSDSKARFRLRTISVSTGTGKTVNATDSPNGLPLVENRGMSRRAIPNPDWKCADPILF